MSDGNDSRLARWSRRKLEARRNEAHEEEKDPGEAGANALSHAPLPDAALPEGAEPETTEPPEPLPRIEDLTADSDVTAFLKKGVPMALKSAALRKMWSIDPNIRDYVGPAEYAWDFNQPGSMAGFGPLKAKETIVKFLSRTVRTLEPDAQTTAGEEPVDAPSAPSAEAPPVAETIDETPSVVPPPERQATPSPAIVDDTGKEDSAKFLPATSTAPSSQNRLSQEREPVPRPRHGGAMPR